MSDPKKEPVVIVVNESDGKSIASDVFTFGCLFGGFWLNHAYMGDGVILQLLLAFCLVVFGSARAGYRCRRMSLAEARAYFCKGGAA